MHVNRTVSNHPGNHQRDEVLSPANIGWSERQLLMACPCPAFILDRNGTIADGNEPFRSLIGYPRENQSGLPIEDILDAESRERLQATDNTTDSFPGTYRSIGGEYLPGTISCRVLPSGETVLFLVPADDLCAAWPEYSRNARLETVGMAAAGIAHHLNALLTVILGNITLGIMDAPPSILPTLRLAEQAALRSASFTGRLLELVRGIYRDPVPLNPDPLIDEAAHFLRSVIDPRVSVSVVRPEPLGLAYADPVSLNHALLTLGMNAWEAIREAGQRGWKPGRHVITIEAKRGGSGPHPETGGADRVIISISDTGEGLSEEVHAHLFEPFFTTKGTRGGTGIGLTTARDMIERCGGRIEASGIPGEGSKFTITLPAAPPGEHIMSEQPQNALSRGTETILFVDDDELVRGFGKTILERLGYTVILASDGDQGLEIYLREQHHIDLMIIDMIMPVLSGDELLRRIRKAGASPRVILTTGFDRESACGQLGELGNVPILLKPFSLRSLTDAVRSALDGGTCAG